MAGAKKKLRKIQTAAADVGDYIYPEEILFAYALQAASTVAMRKEVEVALGRLRKLRDTLKENES